MKQRKKSDNGWGKDEKGAPHSNDIEIDLANLDKPDLGPKSTLLINAVVMESSRARVVLRRKEETAKRLVHLFEEIVIKHFIDICQGIVEYSCSPTLNLDIELVFLILWYVLDGLPLGLGHHKRVDNYIKEERKDLNRCRKFWNSVVRSYLSATE